MYLYVNKPEGFSREDMEAAIKAMTREAMQAEARASGLEEGVVQLKNALIEDVLEESEIKEGDKCVMHFSDGDETVEFVEAKRGGIYVRHFGSKGKPHKHPTRYDYTFAELLEKPNSPICVEADGGESPPACSDYLREAMDYIIDQIGWADKFPRQCHDRIRKVCAAVKRGEPLPFKPNDQAQFRSEAT